MVTFSNKYFSLFNTFYDECVFSYSKDLYSESDCSDEKCCILNSSELLESLCTYFNDFGKLIIEDSNDKFDDVLKFEDCNFNLQK